VHVQLAHHAENRARTLGRECGCHQFRSGLRRAGHGLTLPSFPTVLACRQGTAHIRSGSHMTICGNTMNRPIMIRCAMTCGVTPMKMSVAGILVYLETM